MIIALQREMNMMEHKNAQEMENLQKENAVLREKYLKLQDDHNAHLILIVVTHQTHQPRANKANTKWREGSSSVTYPIQRK